MTSPKKAEIYNCLAYCEYQNGMDHCKNCGLDEELIDDIISQTHTELLTTLKEKIDKETEEVKKELDTSVNPHRESMKSAVELLRIRLHVALIGELLVTDKQ
jgi:hypothetical protein